MENQLEGTMYGGSYRGYNVWRFMYRMQCTDNHIEGKMYGASIRGYSVCRLIYMIQNSKTNI